MKRRNFLKKFGTAAAAPLLLNNIPVNSLASTNVLNRLAASMDGENDRVLVLIQLHGGNDGLNTFIPIDQFTEYRRVRQNIAISNTGSRSYIELDTTVSDNQRIGLHPDMKGLKTLYDEGSAAIIQSVAYENMNQSHFRSQDIWHMGGDYDDYLGSGWMGRYLDNLYPGYPEDYPSEDMPDPLGLEIGNSVSLAFHRAEGIPTAISVQNPEQFYNLITNVGVNPPESIENTLYGKELKWIIDIEEKSNQYAGRLKDLFEEGKKAPSATYPETYNQPVSAERNKTNSLAAQLKVVANLIKGGSKTKIYLVRLGGFDTHANQVDPFTNTSLGNHAVLLYYLSETIKVFIEDLKIKGVSNRVMGATFSEFGRRVASNGSYGTDHGSATPMIVFGENTLPGIHGTNPDLSDLEGGNIKQQFDYRQVFTSLLKDWMCASDEAIQQTLFSDFVENRLPIVGNGVGITDSFNANSTSILESPWPNPTVDFITYSYNIARASEINLSLWSSSGQKIKDLVNEYQLPGNYTISDNLDQLPKGAYILRLTTNRGIETAKKIIKS